MVKDAYEQKGIDLDGEPLFKDFDDVKKAISKYRLSETTCRNLKYYIEVQKRSSDIELIKRFLEGKANEEEVDLRKRTSHLFRVLHNEKESLLMFEGLSLKILFPRQGENHVISLVLEEPDARRKILQIHCKSAHRQYLYIYTVFCRSYFCVGAMKICIEVCRSCPNCEQMNYRRKLR